MKQKSHGYVMGGTTPTGRSKSYAYYKTRSQVKGDYHRVKCTVVDSQIPDLLDDIVVDARLTRHIRTLYEQHLDQIKGPALTEEIERVEIAVKRVVEEEANLARLFATGKLSEDAYVLLRKEWQAKLFEAKATLHELERTRAQFVGDLDAALYMMPHLRRWFEQLLMPKRSKLLRILFNHIIIDPSGNVIEFELAPPFIYLDHLHERVRGNKRPEHMLGGSRNFQRSPLLF